MGREFRNIFLKGVFCCSLLEQSKSSNKAPQFRIRGFYFDVGWFFGNGASKSSLATFRREKSGLFIIVVIMIVIMVSMISILQPERLRERPTPLRHFTGPTRRMTSTPRMEQPTGVEDIIEGGTRAAPRSRRRSAGGAGRGEGDFDGGDGRRREARGLLGG